MQKPEVGCGKKQGAAGEEEGGLMFGLGFFRKATPPPTLAELAPELVDLADKVNVGLPRPNPMPCDVYGHDPLKVPEAYMLGEFKPLSKDERNLSWLPIPSDKYSDQVREEVLIGEAGQWRYRLIPKHAHQCCPDCGLDRHRIEELEKRLQKQISDLGRISGAPMEKIADAVWAWCKERDHVSRTTALEKRVEAIENGSAPGVISRIANNEDTCTELRAAIDRLGKYVEQLAALGGKRLGMSDPVEYQPSRPTLVDVKKHKEK